MKNPNPPNIVTIAILTTITIIFWIFFGVYRVLTSEAAVIVPNEALSPLNPTLDQGALGKLEERIFFEEGETVEFKINPASSEQEPVAVEPTSTPTPTEETVQAPASSEEVEEASPEASLEG